MQKYSDGCFAPLIIATVLIFLVGAVSLTASASTDLPSVNTPPLPKFVPATAANFRFDGRFDFSDTGSPVIVWSGSRLGIDFSGDRLVLVFGHAIDQNFFNVTVDGAAQIVGVPTGSGFRYVWPCALGPGRHQLELFKRSEAAKGHVPFRGVEISADEQTWMPASRTDRLRMEFFGDSITAGACNEDGATDQWDDFRTHNHALSYAALTSVAFHADHRAMAVSGMGIVLGYVDVTAGQVWDKTYPRADSMRGDLQAWQPDVAFVNLGENDDAFSRSEHRPFPGGFAEGYVSLVRAIRSAHPRSQLVLLRGGMFGGAKSAEYRSAWEAAVKELESNDAAIGHYVFTHWSELHPRVSDHRTMADELTSWLKQQPFMQKFLKD